MVCWSVFITTLKYQEVKNLHFGDSLNIMQDEIESTLDQIKLNIGKLRKYGKLEILVWEDGKFCDNL